MALTVEQLKAHPRGQVHFNGSQLMQATMGRFSITNNAKLKSTLARNPNAIVIGNVECEGSVEIDIPEEGAEWDYILLVKTGKKVAFNFEIPAENVTVEGVLQKYEGEIPLDDAVKATVGWIGTISNVLLV